VVTDDDLQHGTAAVQVLRDVTVVVPAPAILIDLEPPVPTSPDDPSVQSLVTTVQKALADRAAVLAASGIVVAGPNVLAAQDATGVPILRLGIWLVDAAFPVEPAAPPDFPLPRLSPVQAEAGFGPAPALRRGHRVGGTDTPFGLRIPVTTLQTLVDVAVSQAGNSDVESVTVSVTEPATVSTVMRGSHLGVDFEIDITETLSTQPVADADPPQSVPHVDSEYSISVGDPLDWLLGALFPILGGLLLIGRSELEQCADQVPGVVTVLTSGLPARIPVRNTSLPPAATGLFDFPQIVLNWTEFGVADGGVEGTGDALLAERDQASARLSVIGPDSLRIPAGESDIDLVYRVELAGIRPDPDALTWRLRTPSGPDDSGTADPGVLADGADIDLDFQLPPHVNQRTFTLDATAVETCGTDPTKTISAAGSESIVVTRLAHTVV
jgi:hypothetical protein